MRRFPLAGLATLAAGPASAHAFDAGADAYGQFVEGAAVVLTFPSILLPLLALGLLLSLWDENGLPRVWPVFLFGQGVGVLLAAVSGPGVGLFVLGLGIVTATLAALLPRIPKVLAILLAGLGGVGALAASLEGHGLFELPVFTHLGLLFGANLATALAAGLCRLALQRIDAHWMRIGWRVAASWIGAILLLTLAFDLTGGVS